MRTPNIDLGITVLAQIELGERFRDQFDEKGNKPGIAAWNQGLWAQIDTDTLDVETYPLVNVEDEDHDWLSGHVVPIDPLTGLPEGQEACGTAYCAAGWANVSAGVPLLFNDHGSVDYTKSGIDVEYSALEVLGWDDSFINDDSDWRSGIDIFSGSNDLDDLYAGFAHKMDMAEPMLRQAVTDRMEFIEAERARRLAARTPATSK